MAKLGGGDSARGWALTMAIFGGLIIVLNLITFATTRERVQPPPGRTASAARRPEGRAHLPALGRDVRPDAPRLHHARRARQLVELLLRLLPGSAERSVAFLGQFGLAASAARPPGWKRRARRPRPAREAGQLERRRRGPEPVLRGRQPGADRRHHRLEAARGPLRQEGRLHRGRRRSRPSRPLRVFLVGPTSGRPAVLAGHPVGDRLGPDGAAAVGDDRGRGRLLRVEDRPPRHRLHVRGHPLRAEGRPEPGRRASAPGSSTLYGYVPNVAQTETRAAGHPPRGERLPGDCCSASASCAWSSTRSARRSTCASRRSSPSAARATSRRRSHDEHRVGTTARTRTGAKARTSGRRTCSRG
ncbi:MAG: hypothetical protein MZV63_15960 [Marinilabiliales bacterium]|nr:hypothetical protein [Marinilabiliales bacterium]